MSRQALAERFAALHRKGDPVVLFNAWDAGSAKAIAQAGAPAIATSSWAVAAAHGHDDGEAIALDLVEAIVARIVASVALPVTVDVEGAYSDDPAKGATNVARIVDRGAVGINFEDRVVAGKGLHAIATQAARIAAIRRMAEARGVPLFVNARCDVFFGAGGAADPMADAIARAKAYADAGASGFFVPGLVDIDAIRTLVAASPLPVNVMGMPKLPEADALAGAGVARISHGPAAYVAAMAAVTTGAQAAYAARKQAA
ncbi:MAG TPA: isocitrate lyase/phosphoenolpyruvate mutase family protein [Xanthomonadales bacterium]|nr:isocitrate lyase/phosphoenolpyruvate mutase family protein [Xanthomonadales bacterium]